jgi:hypothetical protein
MIEVALLFEERRDGGGKTRHRARVCAKQEMCRAGT